MKMEKIEINLQNHSMPPITVKGNENHIEIMDSNSGGQSNSIFLDFEHLKVLKGLIDRYIDKIEKFNELKSL